MYYCKTFGALAPPPVFASTLRLASSALRLASSSALRLASAYILAHNVNDVLRYAPYMYTAEDMDTSACINMHTTCIILLRARRRAQGLDSVCRSLQCPYITTIHFVLLLQLFFSRSKYIFSPTCIRKCKCIYSHTHLRFRELRSVSLALAPLALLAGTEYPPPTHPSPLVNNARSTPRTPACQR
jgi:hypothetical protein